MTKLLASIVLAIAATSAGCLTEIQTSSATFVPPARSGAHVAESVPDAARELTQLLGARGYTLVSSTDMTTSPGLELKYSNGFAAPGTAGSVVYVFVTPASPTTSMVRMLGKPTVGTDEPCSIGTGFALPCTTVQTSERFADAYMTGRAEAQVVRGVLSELQLDGVVVGPASAPPPPAAIAAACHAKRHAVFAEASAIRDADARAKLLTTAPECAGG